MVAPPHKLLVNTVCNASTIATAYTAYTASAYTACAAFCLQFLHSSRYAYIYCFMDRALHKYSFGSFMLKEQRGRDWSMGQVGWVIPLGLFRLLEHLLKTELYFDSETKCLQLLGKSLFEMCWFFTYNA